MDGNALVWGYAMQAKVMALTFICAVLHLTSGIIQTTTDFDTTGIPAQTLAAALALLRQ